jgi:arylsulfatase A-like enzyme
MLLLVLFLPPEVSGADALRPPHVVFLLADDLGWADVGFHGSPIQTPNLDRLAAAGARLESFYVQPVCSPTRAALLTGRYPIRHGLQVGVIRPWAQYGLPLEERTLAQALSEAGYLTAICGKWHLGLHAPEYLPTHRGFQRQYGHYCGALDYFTHRREGGLDWHRNDQVCEDAGYTTILLGDEAVRTIQRHDPAQPLFLYVPFNAPHTPLQVPAEYLTPYEQIANQKRRTYAAMVHCLDEQVGRIVAAIEARSMTDDTLFIFCSDNGGPTQSGATNRPLRAGKGTLYEGGVRVAACAAWKGTIQPGLLIQEPLHIVDWYPTLLRLSGASISQNLPLDGTDIWPVLTENQPSPHDHILLNATPSGGAVRAGDWKLVVRGGRSAVDETLNARASDGAATEDPSPQRPQGQVELFNLAEDLAEQHNLTDQYPAKVEQLTALLRDYQQEAVPPRNAPRSKDFRVPEIWGQSSDPTAN